MQCLAQELQVLNAPKVRTSLAVLSFTKTPLFKGETNQSRFLMPLLHVDTVVDAIVEALDSGLSKTIFLPGIFRFFCRLGEFLYSLTEFSLTECSARSPRLVPEFDPRRHQVPECGVQRSTEN